MNAPATTLIVDDEMDMRLLVRVVIELANEGLSVVGEAADGVEAFDVWRELAGPPQPDVVILDNRMPRQGGIDTAAKMLAERPGQIVILYSAFLDAATRAKAKEIGIAACLDKNQLQTLPDTIRGLVGAH